MATEVLHAHNIILPPQRIRAVRRNPNPGCSRKSPPAGRRHQGRRTAAAPARAAAAEVYAGPAFSASPEPSALPLPQFPVKKAAVAVAAAVDDEAATRDLRRILRLE